MLPGRRSDVPQPFPGEQSPLHTEHLPPPFLRSHHSSSMLPSAWDFDSAEVPGAFPFCNKPIVTPSADCGRGESGCFPATPEGRCLEKSLEHGGSLGQQKALSQGVSSLLLASQGVSKHGQRTAARAANFSQKQPVSLSGLRYFVPSALLILFPTSRGSEE